MIQINDTWAVGGDSLNIILYRKSAPVAVRNQAGGRWEAVCYYGTLQAALSGMVRNGLLQLEMASLSALANRIDELERDIKKIAPVIRPEDLKGGPENSPIDN